MNNEPEPRERCSSNRSLVIESCLKKHDEIWDWIDLWSLIKSTILSAPVNFSDNGI